MQDKTPLERRAPYTGRFAASAEGAPPRADARSRAAASGRTGVAAQPQRRPSGFAAPEAPKRQAPPAPPAAAGSDAPEDEPKRSGLFSRKPKGDRRDRSTNKRSRVKRGSWKKRLLILLLVLLALFALFVLIFGREDKTYHQLPRIERGGDSAYDPEQSPSPEGGEAGEAGETGEAEYLVNPGAADAGGDSGDVDWSQYLVTPEPGQDLSAAAAAAGASLDAGEDAGADEAEG